MNFDKCIECVTTPQLEHHPIVLMFPFAVNSLSPSLTRQHGPTFCEPISLLRTVSHHVEVWDWKNNLHTVLLPIREKWFCPCLRRQATILELKVIAKFFES